MEHFESEFPEPFPEESSADESGLEPAEGADGFDGSGGPDDTGDFDDPLAPASVEPGAPEITDPAYSPAPELEFPDRAEAVPEPGGFPNFDPATATEVVGDPAEAMGHWHRQEQGDTCAVASQEFVLESCTGRDISEAELVEVATANGWYTPGAGTSLENTGRLLEAYGVPTESGFEATIDDLRAHLEAGEQVIVGLDGDELAVPGGDPLTDELLEDTIGIPGQDANHAVQVIGMTESELGPVVVLNDPGQADGRGIMVPVAEFESAWADSGNFEVHAGPGVAAEATAAPQPGAGPGLGYSYSAGETTDGDPVSYSTREDRYYNERTWETVEEV